MLWRAVAQASWPIALCAVALPAPAHSQPRPDAGTLQEPQRLLPALPAPGGPRVILPPATPPDAAPATVRIIPTEFRLEGNRIFATPVLAQDAGLETIEHNAMDELAAHAVDAKAAGETVGYVAVGVYSMGGLCPLDALLALSRAHDLFLYLDDAHGTSIYRRARTGTSLLRMWIALLP